MATRVYATEAQYAAAYPDSPAPSNLAMLLRVASRIVDRLLRAVVYKTDTAGMPTTPEAVEAMADATCAIAAECAATGVLTPGGTQQWDSVGIGNVSLSGRGVSAEAEVVDGIPVPGVAMLALQAVGPVVVIQR